MGSPKNNFNSRHYVIQQAFLIIIYLFLVVVVVRVRRGGVQSLHGMNESGHYVFSTPNPTAPPFISHLLFGTRVDNLCQVNCNFSLHQSQTFLVYMKTFRNRDPFRYTGNSSLKYFFGVVWGSVIKFAVYLQSITPTFCYERFELSDGNCIFKACLYRF